MAGPAATGGATWSSRLGFILATVGAAVGLGNFWRFPYLAGESGGGAFVLVYLACIFAIAIPLAMTELLIGRKGHRDAVSSTGDVAVALGKSRHWASIGWLGMIATFLIGTFYCVIGGWVIFYIIQSVTVGFSPDTETTSAVFNGLLASPGTLILYQVIFILMTVMVPVWGVNAGIERAVNVLMPALFIMMIGLVGYSVMTNGFGEAVTFLFSVDFSKITFDVVLSAIGQAFFSVGVGMAILLTYGAYLKHDTNLPSSAVLIALADTGVAILAGLVIFPLVFANDLDPASGPGLVFQTLPLAFGQMTGGGIIGFIFFTLLLFAALTSSIAIVEIVASFLEQRNINRKKSALIVGVLFFVLGLGTVFSFNIWSGFAPLGFVALFEGKTIFDTIDFITGSFMLVTAGFLISMFGGWVLPAKFVAEEFGWAENGVIFFIWRVLMRFVIPLLMAYMIINIFIG